MLSCKQPCEQDQQLRRALLQARWSQLRPVLTHLWCLAAIAAVASRIPLLKGTRPYVSKSSRVLRKFSQQFLVDLQERNEQSDLEIAFVRYYM